MIRRSLTRILIVALLAFCGYNWWQMRQMQAELTSLRGQVAFLAHHVPVDPQPTDWISQAQGHIENAQSALRRSDWLTARRETAAGMGDLREAATQQKAGTEQTIAAGRLKLVALRAQMERLQKQANQLWQSLRSTPGGRAL